MDQTLSCTLRVTASDPEVARVTVRRRQFDVGRPIELDEAAPRVAALEYALGALAAEAVNGIRVFAKRRRLDIDAVEALITGELSHGLAYLEVVGEPGLAAIARIHLRLFVASPDDAAVRVLWRTVLDRLPLLGTLRRVVPFEIELVITP